MSKLNPHHRLRERAQERRSPNVSFRATRNLAPGRVRARSDEIPRKLGMTQLLHGALAAISRAAVAAPLLGALWLSTATALAQEQPCDLICQGVLVDNDVPFSAVLAPGADEAMVTQPNFGVDAVIDSDGDGLTNADETLYAADPNNPDTDFDTISDGDEIYVYGTFPWAWDTDNDDISDGKEVFITYTNPRSADSDGDGYSDSDELYYYRTDPNDYDSYPLSQGRRQ